MLCYVMNKPEHNGGQEPWISVVALPTTLEEKKIQKHVCGQTTQNTFHEYSCTIC